MGMAIMQFLRTGLMIYLVGVSILLVAGSTTILYYFVTITKNFPNWNFFSKAVRIILVTIIYLLNIKMIILFAAVLHHYLGSN